MRQPKATTDHVWGLGRPHGSVDGLSVLQYLITGCWTSLTDGRVLFLFMLIDAGFFLRTHDFLQPLEKPGASPEDETSSLPQ
jgi:hypothetical protein